MKTSSSPFQIVYELLKVIFVVLVFLSAWKMGSIAMPYLLPPFPTDIDFLASKQIVIDKKHWLIAFYIHISSSVVVISVGITQFSKKIMLSYPKLHRLMGKIYIFLILLVACPSGFVMAFYGNGGPSAQLAFILQALAWWYLTFMAYRQIHAGKVKAHGEYMIRSYAMTLSAISLRAATYLISYWKLENQFYCPSEAYPLLCYPDFYIMVAWLSWIVNLIIAECLILGGIMRYYLGSDSS